MNVYVGICGFECIVTVISNGSILISQRTKSHLIAIASILMDSYTSLLTHFDRHYQLFMPDIVAFFLLHVRVRILCAALSH